MADYKKMYMRLFNATTNAISILQQAQIEMENEYMEQDENNIRLLPKPEDDPED